MPLTCIGAILGSLIQNSPRGGGYQWLRDPQARDLRRSISEPVATVERSRTTCGLPADWRGGEIR